MGAAPMRSTPLRSLPVHILLAAALLVLAVALRVADPEPVARLRLAVFDTYPVSYTHLTLPTTPYV